METDTKTYLAGRGFMLDDRPHKSRIMDEVRALVPVIESLEDVDEKAAPVQSLREQVLGSSGDEDVDQELNYLLGDVLTVAPAPTERKRLGKLQDALDNGYVLCSVRVRRGEEQTSYSARFISSDADVVERYSEEPAIHRAVKATESATRTIEMAGKRIPILASRRPVLARKTQEQLALAMPLDES